MESHRTALELIRGIDLTASPFPWWEWDVLENTVSFNDLKVTALGYTPDRFHGRGYQAFTELVHPDDHSQVMRAMIDLLEERADLYQTDYRIRDVEGVYHWYMDRGFAIARQGKIVTRVRGLVIDLGREARAGHDIEILVDLLRSVARDRDHLVTVCSTCQRVRTGSHTWTSATPEFQAVITDRLSHTICEECLIRLYPDIAGKVLSRLKAQDLQGITAVRTSIPSASAPG